MNLEDAERDDRVPLLVQARVRKLSSDDALLALTPDVKVGDVFIVDLSTRHRSVLLNKEYKVLHEKEIVQCAETGGWIAMECVELFV